MAQNNRIVFQNKLNKSINVKNSKNLLLNKNVINTNTNNNNIPPIISFKKLPIEFYYF